MPLNHGAHLFWLMYMYKIISWGQGVCVCVGGGYELKTYNVCTSRVLKWCRTNDFSEIVDFYWLLRAYPEKENHKQNIGSLLH